VGRSTRQIPCKKGRETSIHVRTKELKGGDHLSGVKSTQGTNEWGGGKYTYLPGLEDRNGILGGPGRGGEFLGENVAKRGAGGGSQNCQNTFLLCVEGFGRTQEGTERGAQTLLKLFKGLRRRPGEKRGRRLPMTKKKPLQGSSKIEGHGTGINGSFGFRKP